MSRTAKTVTITSGEYTAEIALRGGQLLTLTSGHDSLVVPAQAAEGAFPGRCWPRGPTGSQARSICTRGRRCT
ncbi:hypothetical protein [Nesterenkonia pannonica]|uniref:hypothetical protein n=1 Tax=Nesterenkonia pannonica TaxID=1548602 RepID=UPI002164C3F9|nr:hypothetical protein [Nesterenkonia pannonica]